MNFKAHGNINIELVNSSVINRPSESFNKEGIEVLFQSIWTLVKQEQLSSWALVELLEKEALPTHEALNTLIAAYKTSRELGCTKILCVCHSSTQEQLMNMAANQANIPIKFYNSEYRALKAL